MKADSMAGAAQEWQSSWPLVMAAFFGMAFHSVTTYSFGLFIQPLSAEFGWSRAEVSAGLSLAAVLSIPLSPILGALVDRWGARRLGLPGIVLMALCLVSFSTANGSVAQWLGLWMAYAVFSVGVNSTVWAAAVSGVFTAARGLALGVTLSGIAFAQTFAPPLTQWLIESFGWRIAFIGLGVGWGAPAFLICVFFFYDSHQFRHKVVHRDATLFEDDIPGLSLSAAFQDRALWRIGAATLTMMVLTIGVIVHQVPLLVEMGVSRQTAAYLASLTGIAGLVGKLTTGYLMDRFHAGVVSGLTIGIAAVAFFLLLDPTGSLPVVVLAMIILGYSSGSKLQICAYQTGRYGGIRNFGKIFGFMSCLVGLGAGLGPFLAGLTYDLSGGYKALVAVGVPASLMSGFLLFRLGPYPIWASSSRPAIIKSTLPQVRLVAKSGGG